MRRRLGTGGARRRTLASLAIAAFAAFGLAACGGSSSNNNTTAASTSPSTATTGGGAAGSGGGGGSTVNISTPSGSTLAYDQKSVSASAGNVTIDFDNKQPLQHDVAVEDSSGKELGATELVASGTANTTVNLQAGTYTFFCTVPGHREAGMQGTLTVK